MDATSDFKKEYLVVLPLFGTTLAISFDVGYFIHLDFDLFNVFSVSEHIAFAMQLVPFIVGASMIMIVCSIAENTLRQGRTSRRRAALIALLGLVFVVSGAVCFYIFNETSLFMAFCILIGFIAILVIILMIIAPRIFLEQNVVLLAAASVLVLSALLLGVDTAARQTQRDRSFKYVIEMADEGLVEARILRSGERGLLVLTPQGAKLLPWSQIKVVSEKGSRTALPM